MGDNLYSSLSIPVGVEVPEDVCEAQLYVSQQLDQPLPVWALHKLGDGLGLAAVYGVRGDVQVPAQGGYMGMFCS